MARWGRSVLASLLAVGATSACFRQVVNTGQAAGSTVIQQSWVSTWVFGLVAAKPIDTRTMCPGGVATVESQTSFVNGLAAGLTIGIWTPQTVRITCGSGTSSIPAGTEVLTVAANASDSAFASVMEQAANRSRERSKPVVVRFNFTESAEEAPHGR